MTPRTDSASARRGVELGGAVDRGLALLAPRPVTAAVRRLVSAAGVRDVAGTMARRELEAAERTSLSAESQGHPWTLSVLLTSFDCNQSAHVHVERESSTCKFWLELIELARSHGFSAHGLNVIRRIIRAQRGKSLETWHEHCG
jgi:hypothetical protein